MNLISNGLVENYDMYSKILKQYIEKSNGNIEKDKEIMQIINDAIDLFDYKTCEECMKLIDEYETHQWECNATDITRRLILALHKDFSKKDEYLPMWSKKIAIHDTDSFKQAFIKSMMTYLVNDYLEGVANGI